MILEIDCHSNTLDTILIDNVASIMLSKPRTTLEKEDFIDREGDSFFIVSHHNVKNRKWFLLEITYSNGKSGVVCFDTVLRILNDDGKLIRKITANI